MNKFFPQKAAELFLYSLIAYYYMTFYTLHCLHFIIITD